MYLDTCIKKKLFWTCFVFLCTIKTAHASTYICTYEVRKKKQQCEKGKQSNDSKNTFALKAVSIMLSAVKNIIAQLTQVSTFDLN